MSKCEMPTGHKGFKKKKKKKQEKKAQMMKEIKNQLSIHSKFFSINFKFPPMFI